ncbi:hypothetical protein OROHE_023757 [Orobanche hederae]
MAYPRPSTINGGHLRLHLQRRRLSSSSIRLHLRFIADGKRKIVPYPEYLLKARSHLDSERMISEGMDSVKKIGIWKELEWNVIRRWRPAMVAGGGGGR